MQEIYQHGLLPADHYPENDPRNYLRKSSNEKRKGVVQQNGDGPGRDPNNNPDGDSNNDMIMK